MKKGEFAYTRFTALIPLIPFFLLAAAFYWVCDDAYISFRYSKHLAGGEGLVFNKGSAPIEGYSNFLWVVIGALFEYIGIPAAIAMPILSLLIGGVFLLYFYNTLVVDFKMGSTMASVATLFLAVFPPYFIWASSGLATVPYLVCLWALYICSRRADNSVLIGVFGICIMLLRVEGIAWSIFIILFFLMRYTLSGEHSKVRILKKGLLILFVSGISYEAFRYAYFSEWISNTVIAKSGFSLLKGYRGMLYVLNFVFTFPGILLFLVMAAVITIRKGIGRSFVLRDETMLFLTALSFYVYSIIAGGDFMTMGRFLVPSLPFIVSVASLALSKIPMGASVFVLAGGISLLPIIGINVVPESFLEKFHFRWNNASYRTELQQWRYMKNNAIKWRELGLFLKSLEGVKSVVMGAVGAVGYYSDLTVYDRFGLTDKNVSELKVSRLKSPGHDKRVSPEYFLEQGYSPDVLMAKIYRFDAVSDRISKVGTKWQALFAERGYTICKYKKGNYLIALAMKRCPLVKEAELLRP